MMLRPRHTLGLSRPPRSNPLFSSNKNRPKGGFLKLENRGFALCSRTSCSHAPGRLRSARRNPWRLTLDPRSDDRVDQGRCSASNPLFSLARKMKRPPGEGWPLQYVENRGFALRASDFLSSAFRAASALRAASMRRALAMRSGQRYGSNPLFSLPRKMKRPPGEGWPFLSWRIGDSNP